MSIMANPLLRLIYGADYRKSILFENKYFECCNVPYVVSYDILCSPQMTCLPYITNLSS